MNKTITRALNPEDLKALDVPYRNFKTFRDGGSWSAEIYRGDKWVKIEHSHEQKMTMIGDKQVTVETTIRLAE